MLVLNPEEAATIRQTVKALAEERNDLKRKLERCDAMLHQLRIINDSLRKELASARKAK
jgi:predicted RNase H-like nuclease (RuvC/YqgF family)